MKKLIAAVLAGIAASAIMCSCATPQTNPGSPAITNAVTGVVTPAIPPSTTYVPNQTVGQVATVGNGVAAALPPPWGAVLTGALALLTAATSTIAVVKNSNLRKTADQLATAQAVHDTIIQGIEAAGAAADAVKQAVAKKALDNGTSDAVDAAVTKITG
jgi:hypothetical protein